MDNRTLTTSSVTIEDIEGVWQKLELGEIKKITPVVFADKYIGNINNFGELTLDCNIPKDTLDRLFKEVLSNMISFGIDYGSGTNEITDIQIEKEIKNIHRVRKGKRYIIKFNYTQYVSLIGKVIRRK